VYFGTLDDTADANSIQCPSSQSIQYHQMVQLVQRTEGITVRGYEPYVHMDDQSDKRGKVLSRECELTPTPSNDAGEIVRDRNVVRIYNQKKGDQYETYGNCGTCDQLSYGRAREELLNQFWSLMLRCLVRPPRWFRRLVSALVSCRWNS
jgi:hypothetical protein